MQDIYELIQVLEGLQLQFPNASNPNAKQQDASVQRLFEGVRTGQYATDADAASDLFPGASADHSNYFEARSTLRSSLAQAIEQFFADLEQYSDVQDTHMKCQMLWLNVRSLSGENAAMLALSFAEHLLRIAEKFDFTLLGMDVALYLRLQFCTREHHGSMCSDADAKHKYFRKVLEAEFQAEKMYTDLTALAVDGHTPNEKVYEMALSYFNTVHPLMRKYPSGKIHLYGNLIALQQYTAMGNYAEAVRCSEKAIRFFQNKPYHARDPLRVFHYQLLLYSIHLRDVDAGEQAARACLALFDTTAFNVFKINELLVLLNLHAGHYANALAIYNKVLANPRFLFLPAPFKNNWSIFEAYLTLLAAMGLVDTPMRMGRTPEEASHTSKSESGTWLVLELANLLQQEQHAEIRKRTADVEQFANKQPENVGRRRTALFLTMLLQIPAANFRYETLVALERPFLEQLQNTPLQLANQAQEIEVIPYENLWKMLILNTLS